MLIDKVCGLNELELEMKNENREPKRKLKKGNQNDKSSYNFQSIFEQEVKKEKYKRKLFLARN